MKKTYMTLLLAAVALLASATAPNGSGTYYQNANGKKGSALKTALCGILWETRYNPALSYNELWTAFHTTDVRSDGKIWDMYSDNTNYEPGGSAQGHNYSGEGESYNREHSFPASWFGSNTPMYPDLHHIYPTDGYINNRRSNYPFGETNGNTYKSHNSFSKLGSCTVSGYTGTVFEPADEYKGDFARTYFYMVTCYEEKLADWYSKNSESRTTINGTKYPAFQTWQLNMLLKWAKDDPVSAKEIARNTAVKNLQGNRNPFIDYPGLEQYIWGSCKDTEFSYNNYVQPTTWSTEYNSSSGSDPDPGTDPNPGTGDEEVADVLNVTGWAGYTNDSYVAPNTDKIGVSSTTGVNYAMQVYIGSSGGVRGNQNSATSNYSCRNTTTYSGYYIKEVKLTVKSGTLDGSTSGRSVVYFGDSPFTTSPSGTATTSNENASDRLSLTWTNTDTSKNYFILYNLKTSGTTKTAVVTVTWGSTAPASAVDPTFNGLSDVSVDWETPLTLAQGTTGTPNFVTDGTVTLTSLNTEVATVDGLTITPVAVGTAMISVSTTATDAYNAGSVMFPITVNAPEGKTTAAPTQSGLLFGETFGDNSGSARAWDDSYSVKSGVSDVYSGITDYTITNAKQSKNTVGSTNSGLVQSTQGTDASIIIGPLNVADYKNLSLTYQWRAGSIKETYSTTAYYATSANGSYTELTGTGNGATTFVTRSYTLPAAAQVATLYLKIVWNTSNTQGVIDEVQLSGTSAATLTKTLNSDGYASYCSEYPLDFSDYESAGYSAWQVTGVSGETITFAQVTGTVKGGTGLILKGVPNEIVTLHSAASTTTLGDNLLVGTIVNTYAETGQYFGLKGNAFVPVAESTVPAGKALLPASLITSNEVKVLNFVFEDDATGISLMEDGRSQMEDGVIYKQGSTIVNLAGQRLDNSQLKRGIYIVNGKKILK